MWVGNLMGLTGFEEDEEEEEEENGGGEEAGGHCGRETLRGCFSLGFLIPLGLEKPKHLPLGPDLCVNRQQTEVIYRPRQG